MSALVASWSKDPSTQTGAVIVRPDKTVASVGFNGFPQSVVDDPEILNNREEKYRRIVHCEMNAVLFSREPLKGFTLYTFPFISCERCAVHMIQAGISRAVSYTCPPDKLERWKDSLNNTKSLFKEAGVEFVEYPFTHRR
jgi:dCMP deaminase